MKTIYYGGRVFAGALPLREAFAVEEGRFLAVGSDEEILALAAAGDERISLEGKFVCPGFNDSHMHLLNYGYTMEICDLSGCGSMDALQQALRSFPCRSDGWILGRGWNQDRFSPAGKIPTRRELDEVSREKPVCIIRCCGHCLSVNSRALELLNLSSPVPEIPGGSCDVDEKGVLTGVFRDNAMGLVLSRLPAPGLQDLKRMLLRGCQALNARGVTSCHSDDFLTFENVPWELVLEAYRELEQEGLLTVRVCQQSQFTTPETLRDFLDRGYGTGWGSPMFRIGPLKLLGDGSLGARTAYLSGTYADAPGQKGIAIFTQEELDSLITLAHSRNMQVAVHAIGDGILDRILASFEKAFRAHPRQDHRSGIVHAQLTRADQLEKMAGLKLHAWVQTVFLDYDSHIVTARAGQALASTSYAFGTMEKMGITLSNGTDCPVEPPDPMRGIRCAVTRQSLDGTLPPYRPEEAMTVEQAIRIYTAGGAYASFEEKEKGEISRGMAADFVILSADPFACTPQALSDIQVEAAFLEGRPVYRKA